MQRFSWKRFAIGGLVFCGLMMATCGWAAAQSTSTANQEFVGCLAIAVDDAGVKRLKLSDEQKEKLLKLIDEREQSVLDLALSLKDATPAEREAKLAPFRAESEKAGMAILDDTQKTELEKLRIQKRGMLTLGEPKIAEKLNLTDEQKEKIATHLTKRTSNMAKSKTEDLQKLNDYYEKALLTVLDDTQRAQWEELAGGAPAGGNVSAPAAAATQTPGAAATPGAAPSTPVVREPPRPDGKMRFQFRYTPWKDVIDWFAAMADYSLVMDVAPQGTFNYTDTQYYTPAEAIDLLNSVLLVKGFCLVKKARMLFVINLEDGIPPDLVDDIPLEELDSHGRYELVRVMFNVQKATPEEVQAAIAQLIGPQGAVVIIPKARMVRVTEIAGRLRMIRSVIEAIENPDGPANISLRVFVLKHAFVSDVLAVARPLLEIPADAFAAQDGSIRIALDPTTGKLLATGKQEKITLLDQIIKDIDVTQGPGTPLETKIETPQFEVHRIVGADPPSILAVCQTIFANSPDVRLSLDPVTKNLAVLARPSQHATIREMIRQMGSEGQRFEGIRLRKVEPQTALVMLNSIYGADGPKCTADPASRMLFVRGTEAQIAGVKSIVQTMEGEGPNAPEGSNAVVDRNTRSLMIHSRQLQQVLERAEQIWTERGGNPVRIVPNPVIPSGRVTPPAAADFRQLAPPNAGPSTGSNLNPSPSQPAAPAAAPAVRPGVPAASPAIKPNPAVPARPPEQRDASNRSYSPRVVLVKQIKAEEPQLPAVPNKNVVEQPNLPADAPTRDARPEILLYPGPRDLTIYSRDLQALDDFELLLGQLIAQLPKYEVYHLNYASATDVAMTLNEILTGGASAAADTGGGGGLLGNVLSGALGPLGGLLTGGGGAPAPSPVVIAGTLSIVPEPRQNLLFVQGSPKELDTVEALLEILDQSDGAKPRFIKVLNTSAAQIAELVRDAYPEQLSGSRGGSQQRQPSPEEFFAALRGGGGGSSRGGSSSRRGGDQQAKMAVAVDERTNSLVINAPQLLFDEVRQMVEMLDHGSPAPESQQVVRVVSLKRTSAANVQKAVAAIAGDKVRTDRPTSGESGSSGRSSSSGGGGGDSDEMRRRMEFFNRMQGGGGSPFGGSFGGGSPFGGSSSSRGGDSGRSFGGFSFGDRGSSGFGGDRGSSGDRGGSDRGGSDRGGSSRGR